MDPRVQSICVLFFEFFPAFVMIVGTITAIWLYAVNRRVRKDPTEQDAERRFAERRAAEARARATAKRETTTVRRPSMRA